MNTHVQHVSMQPAGSVHPMWCTEAAQSHDAMVRGDLTFIDHARVAGQTRHLFRLLLISARHAFQLKHGKDCLPASRSRPALTIAASFTKAYLLLGAQEWFTRDRSGYSADQLHTEQAFTASGSVL